MVTRASSPWAGSRGGIRPRGRGQTLRSITPLRETNAKSTTPAPRNIAGASGPVGGGGASGPWAGSDLAFDHAFEGVLRDRSSEWASGGIRPLGGSQTLRSSTRLTLRDTAREARRLLEDDPSQSGRPTLERNGGIRPRGQSDPAFDHPPEGDQRQVDHPGPAQHSQTLRFDHWLRLPAPQGVCRLGSPH